MLASRRATPRQVLARWTAARARRGSTHNSTRMNAFRMTWPNDRGKQSGMARDKSTRKAEPTRGSPASAEKTIISIRMQIEVLNFVEAESRSARGRPRPQG